QRAPVVAHRAQSQLRADAALHAEGAIELALRVDVHGALQREALSERPRPPALALAHDDQLRAARADRVKLAVQLHRLLLAQVSAEVANECEHHRAALPQPAQLDLAIVEVAQLGARGVLADLLHGLESYLSLD